MVIHDVKVVDIAKKLNVSPTTVYVVVSGFRKTLRIQEAILTALKAREEKVHLQDFWPDGDLPVASNLNRV